MQKVSGGAGAPYGRYLVARTQSAEGRGDYYLNRHGRQEAPGRWAVGPAGAALLDVDSDQPISPDQLANLLAVAFPNDPSRALRRGSNGTATAAIDLTFSAPKSVSVVWALGSEPTRRAIERAHERAIDVALAHAVEHVPMLRRRIDRETVIRERPAELLASVYRHTTARAVDYRPPDPQLHSHVLLHGAIRRPRADDDEPDQAVAIESRAVMVHQRELGAAYRAELADALRELGYAIERGTGRDGRYFEIKGVPRSVLERFSSRHRQVVERIEWRKLERLHGLRALAQLDGDRGVEARARLRAVERELAPYEDALSEVPSDATFDLLERRDGLRDLSRRLGPVGDRARERLHELERWGDRLSPAQERVVARESRAAKALETHGDLDRVWGEEAARLGFDAGAAAALSRDECEPSLDRASLRRATVENLTLHKATFLPREARAVVLETASSRREAEGVLAELADAGEIIRLEQGRWTTTAQRTLERDVLAHVKKVAVGRVRRVEQQLVEAELDRLRTEYAPTGGLAPEQEEAVRAATSDRQLVAIQGQAGTGKSTALIASARAEAAAGRRFVVTSTAGQAAERLAHELRAAGVPAEAFSTRALDAACQTGGIRLGPDTTVIHDECALAATAEQNFLFWACRDAGARLIEVGDREQNLPVGAGGLMERVESLAREHGRFVALEHIVRSRDEDDRRLQRALRGGDTEHVVASLDQRQRLVVAATRAEASERAAELWDRHRHGDDGALVICEASNQQVDELNAQLQAIRREAGELGELPVDVPGKPYALYALDEVVVRAQFYDTGIGRIRNGERATVSRIEDGQVELDLGADRIVSLDAAGLQAADVRLAYAQHANPAQGTTTGVAIDLFGQLSTRRGQYVSLTRAREAHYLVTSYEDLDLEEHDPSAARRELAVRMRRDEPELPSVDLLELASDAAARADALRVVSRHLGDDVAQRVARSDDPEAEHLTTVSTADLGQRAHAMRAQLERSGASRVDVQADSRRVAERARLDARLDAERQRLTTTRAAIQRLGRLERRERARLDRLATGQARAIADLERRIDVSEDPAPRDTPGPPPETVALAYVQVERELGRRLCAAHDRAALAVRLGPELDVIERVGERPPPGPERQEWERRAAVLERERERLGALPSARSGPAEAPDEWRTAPAVLRPALSDRAHAHRERDADRALDL